MNHKTFDQFCPECNILVQTNVIGEAHEEFLNMYELPLELDQEYTGYVYYISLCVRCKHPFFIQQKFHGVASEFEAMTEEITLYPKSTKVSLDNLPDLIKLSYQDATKSFLASLFEPCVLMCRKTLEVICKLNNAQGNNLFEKLENLKELGLIDQRILDWSHEIRSIGNDAAHDISLVISKEDARDSLDLTEAILLYIFSLNSRFQNFKQRRLKLDNECEAE